jgi:hypothetical protein
MKHYSGGKAVKLTNSNILYIIKFMCTSLVPVARPCFSMPDRKNLTYHFAHRLEARDPDKSVVTLSHRAGSIPEKCRMEEFFINLASRCGLLGACCATESDDVSVAKELLEMLRNEDAPGRLGDT